MLMESNAVKYSLDAAAGLVALGALAQVLPPLAAFMSIVWLGVQLYDRFLGKGKRDK